MPCLGLVCTVSDGICHGCMCKRHKRPYMGAQQNRRAGQDAQQFTLIHTFNCAGRLPSRNILFSSAWWAQKAVARMLQLLQLPRRRWLQAMQPWAWWVISRDACTHQHAQHRWHTCACCHVQQSVCTCDALHPAEKTTLTCVLIIRSHDFHRIRCCMGCSGRRLAGNLCGRGAERGGAFVRAAG